VKWSPRLRFALTVGIAATAAAITLTEYSMNVGRHSDFAPAWFGARALLAGSNPWAQVGPGLTFDWPWPLLYPAPALVLAIPFAAVTEIVATATLVGASTFLLVWGVTRSGPHRLPAFASLPFFIASAAGQWTALLGSGWFLPLTAFAWIAKPTIGLALLVATASVRSVAIAVSSGVVLLLVSFALSPGWVPEWVSVIRDADHMQPLAASRGGFIVFAALLRWRRPEARLLLAMALVPQTPAFYDLLLILLIVPATLRQAMAMTAVCNAGLLLLNLVPVTEETFVPVRAMASLVFCYLPALIIVLRRENAGAPPAVVGLAPVFARR
jgi:hypothetical protein